MKYVVFDLDQTLAELEAFYYFIRNIRLKEYMTAFRPFMTPHISQEFENQLEMAYHNFVHLILQEELSNQPLGLIRPGVLPMMRYLAKQKRKNRIGHVVIYSNNRVLQNLEAVRDIINVYVNINLIESCIHWDHPIRLMDKQHPAYTKTWDTLKLILINDGAPSDLHPNDVLFFDDQPHPFLQYSLRTNYCLISPYQFYPSFDRIATLFLQAINTARINHMEMMVFLIDMLDSDRMDQPPIQLSEQSLYGVLSYMRELVHSRVTESLTTSPPLEDRGMQMMKTAIQMRFGGHRHNWTRKNRNRMTIKKPISRRNDITDLSYRTDHSCPADCRCIVCIDAEKRGVFCTSM
jgi:hypothetical protein